MINWGVAGPGEIATFFAEAMTLAKGGAIVAVVSRSQERANAFGDRFGIGARYGNYEALADDRDVDVVYVATPQSRHASDVITYLQGGKHVLCEKPFALNASEARQMADVARAQQLFLMEGMWSRFLPTYRSLVEVLGAARIGEALQVEADFGIRRRREHRLFMPELGGGGLLDQGVYPLQLSSLVLGQPDHVVAAGLVGNTGVDEQVGAVLHHQGGRLGLISASIRVGTSCTARVSGTEGWIDIPAMMHSPDALTVCTPGKRERIDGNYEGNGLQFEIAEVHRCLEEGLTQSPTMTLDETIGLATTMDAIRAQIGLVYPGEQIT